MQSVFCFVVDIYVLLFHYNSLISDFTGLL